MTNGLQEGRGDLLFVKESFLPWICGWLWRRPYTYLIPLVYLPCIRMAPHQLHIRNDLDEKGLEMSRGRKKRGISIAADISQDWKRLRRKTKTKRRAAAGTNSHPKSILSTLHKRLNIYFTALSIKTKEKKN